MRSTRVPDAGAPDLPVLWHLKVSNYNEKARWALDVKGVPHLRRAVDAGRHRRIARRLTGGRTFPVLVLDGEAIGDSARIVAALERRHPDPPLYPDDVAARRRALELAAFFDAELGPYVRLLVLHAMLPDARLLLDAFAPDLSRPRRLAARATFPLLRRRVISEFRIDDAMIAHAYERIHATGLRFREALQPSGYLVGDRFGVADLTLAALVSPAVAPEQFPYAQPQRAHPRLDGLREALAAAGILDWARSMYVLHRGVTAEASAPARVTREPPASPISVQQGERTSAL